MKKYIFPWLFLFGFFQIQPASAWGPVGHETIAYIASDNLTPAATKKINALLNDYSPGCLASISNWADEISHQGRPETAPWHYIDLPIRKNITVQDVGNYCPKGNCVTSKLKYFEGVLRDATQPREKRVEALKFVVHFMGDLHMPLHCANDDDHGGNDKLVRYMYLDPKYGVFGINIKLHALWDGLVREGLGWGESREMSIRLEKGITDNNRKAWVAGNADAWCFESYQVAKNVIYKGMAPGSQNYTHNPLPLGYYDQMRPIVDTQLEKAGIRLAYVLNRIFAAKVSK